MSLFVILALAAGQPQLDAREFKLRMDEKAELHDGDTFTAQHQDLSPDDARDWKKKIDDEAEHGGHHSHHEKIPGSEAPSKGNHLAGDVLGGLAAGVAGIAALAWLVVYSRQQRQRQPLISVDAPTQNDCYVRTDSNNVVKCPAPGAAGASL